jgi:drug/metabolite transporter (DMT)-like permease
MKNHRLSAGLMITQGVLFAVETAMVHQIGPRASVMQLSLLRSLAGLFVVAVLMRGIGLAVVRTRHLPLQLLRGFVTVAYSWVMFYSFSQLPFADATAIAYTQAAYIAVFSAIILQEVVTVRRWTAAVIGIIGAALIVKPAFLDWNGAYLVALIGTSLNGLAFVLNKVLHRHGDSELTTMLYANLIPAVCNLPVLMTASPPAPEVWPLLSGVLFFGPLGMYLGIVALRYADASTLGPYTLLRLVIAVGGGAIVFGEIPDLLSFLGAFIILASCLLATVPAKSLVNLRRYVRPYMR